MLGWKNKKRKQDLNEVVFSGAYCSKPVADVDAIGRVPERAA